MFSAAYQSGEYMEVFDSKNYLEKDKENANLLKIEVPKQSQKILDKLVKCQVLEIGGQQNRVKLPKSDKSTLGLFQRYLVIQIYIPHIQTWSLELMFSDETKSTRVHFSGECSRIERKQYNLILPCSNIIPVKKWINLQIDCASFLDNQKGVKFRGIERISISSPSRIRRIFTMRNPIPQWKGKSNHKTSVNHVTSIDERDEESYDSREFSQFKLDGLPSNLSLGKVGENVTLSLTSILHSMQAPISRNSMTDIGSGDSKELGTTSNSIFGTTNRNHVNSHSVNHVFDSSTTSSISTTTASTNLGFKQPPLSSYSQTCSKPTHDKSHKKSTNLLDNSSIFESISEYQSQQAHSYQIRPNQSQIPHALGNSRKQSSQSLEKHSFKTTTNSIKSETRKLLPKIQQDRSASNRNQSFEDHDQSHEFDISSHDQSQNYGKFRQFSELLSYKKQVSKENTQKKAVSPRPAMKQAGISPYSNVQIKSLRQSPSNREIPHSDSSTRDATLVQNTTTSTIYGGGSRASSRLGKNPLIGKKTGVTSAISSLSRSPKAHSTTATSLTSQQSINPWNNSNNNSILGLRKQAFQADIASDSQIDESSSFSYAKLQVDGYRRGNLRKNPDPLSKEKSSSSNNQPRKDINQRNNEQIKGNKSTSKESKLNGQQQARRIQQVSCPTDIAGKKKPNTTIKSLNDTQKQLEDGKRLDINMRDRSSFDEQTYKELTQKFSTMGDPNQFKHDNNNNNNKYIQEKGVPSQSQITQKQQSASKKGSQQQSVSQEYRRKEESSPTFRQDYRMNFDGEVPEEIEENIEMDSKIYEDERMKKVDNNSKSNQKKAIKYTDGYDKYSDSFANESFEFKSSRINATGIEFSKPNFIIKRVAAGQFTEEVENVEMRIEKQTPENLRRIQALQMRDDDESYRDSAKQQSYQVQQSQQYTQSGFFKDQIMKFMISSDLRPFTPPFNPMVNRTPSKRDHQSIISNRDDQQIELLYDDILSCYYDPKNKQYYEIKQ